MPTTYTLADPDVTSAVDSMMRKYHAELTEAEVRVGVLIARNETGNPIKHGGYPARATVRIVPLKDRLTKGYDAEMLIDGRELDLMRPEHLNALVDHELTHLRVCLNDDDESPEKYKLDDLGRPKLKTRPGDWNAGDGFKEVVARHGDYAAEFENLSRAMTAANAAKSEGEAAA